LIHVLLPIALFFTPIVEKIHLTDALVVSGRYMDAGEALTDEGMLMSVEDFGLLQGHYLTLEPIWQARIDELRALHLKQIEEIQSDYRAQIDMITRQNKALEGDNESLATMLASERDKVAIMKWATIGAAVVTTGAVIYALGK